MKQHKSEYYIFNFNEGSKAEKDIEAISSMQERCYKYICQVLKTEPSAACGYWKTRKTKARKH